MNLIRVDRSRTTRTGRRSRQIAAGAIAGVLATLVLATPATARPVAERELAAGVSVAAAVVKVATPLQGEGAISLVRRTCGSASGWATRIAGYSAPSWLFYGQRYHVTCGGTAPAATRPASARASRSGDEPQFNPGGWVHPLASGVRARNSGACPGAPRYDSAGNYDHAHAGIDLSAGSGTPVRSVAAGTVTVSHYSGSAGYYVVINHSGATSTYMHLRQRGLGVGSRVNAGQIIGLVGATGNAQGPHLHFEATGSGNTAQTARAHGLSLGC